MRSRNSCSVRSRDSCSVRTRDSCSVRLRYFSIETHTHHIPVLLKQVYGDDSLATLRVGIGSAYGL